MLSDEVRARLSELNRRPLSAGEQKTAAQAEKVQAPPRQAETHSPERSTKELSPGREVENDAGRHWLVEVPLAQLWPKAPHYLRGYSDDVAADQPTDAAPADIAELRRHFPQGAIFLDLETCGFAGSMVFLVGLLRPGKERPVLSQLLARNYAEEKAMFQTLWELAQTAEVLVTFNGKSFDWPVVLDRITLHRIERQPRRRASPVENSLVHVDLLHHARRRWKQKLPDCKLTTLERYVCGRHRAGDIPGREIPAAYHSYVKSGDAWQLRSILRHNALDLLTLLQLSLCIMRPGAWE